MYSQWVLISLTTLFYGLFNIFTRAAGPKIGGILGPLLLEGFATALLLVFFLWRKFNGSVELSTSPGVAFSLAAGFCAAARNGRPFHRLLKGGTAFVGGSFVLIGSTVLTILGGLILFKEPIGSYRAVGLILGVISLFLLRME